MKRVVIEQDQWKTFGRLLVAFAFIAICICLRYQDLSKLDRLIVSFGVWFLPACSIGILYRLIRPKDILIIDSDGVTDNSSFASLGFIPWSNVKSVSILTIRKRVRFVNMTTKYLYIAVHDMEAVLSTLPAYKRRIATISIAMGFEPLMIRPLYASETVEEIFAILKEYHEASLSLTKEG